ncbi:hypothetical protein [Staphylococcus delphini]|nr:hypothetical protein [Staphylococcus delphini]MDE9830355.1 hypothetical protein [Staphylococcus delphini]
MASQEASYKGLNDISTSPNRMIFSLIASEKVNQNNSSEELVKE